MILPPLVFPVLLDWFVGALKFCRRKHQNNSLSLRHFYVFVVVAVAAVVAVDVSRRFRVVFVEKLFFGVL